MDPAGVPASEHHPRIEGGVGPMARNAYRAAYERLKAGLGEARMGDDPDALSRAGAELDCFVAALLTDRRKLRLIADESPACAAEIEGMSSRISLPRMVLDPAHDPSYARLWLASLGDEKVAMLRRVLNDEAAGRASAHAVF
jgi:hypothetical protein